MKDLSNNTELVLSGTQHQTVIDSSSDLLSKVICWDLRQLQGITTYDCVKDDAARKKAAQKLSQRNSMLTGAVVGGVLDAAGGDDSILDGILLGAMFGAVCSANQDKAVGRIGLVFWDGSHLALAVDQDEYTRLQSIAEANLLAPKPDVAPASTHCSLSREAMDNVLHRRSVSSMMFSFLFAMVTLIGSTTLINLIGGPPLTISSMPGVDLFQIAFAVISIGVIITSIVRFFMPQSYLLNTTEKTAYENAAAVDGQATVSQHEVKS